MSKTVAQKSVSLDKMASLTVTFNLHNQPAGMYYVKVNSIDGVQTVKLLLQRSKPIREIRGQQAFTPFKGHRRLLPSVVFFNYNMNLINYSVFPYLYD